MTGLAAVLVRLLARTLPPRLRSRYDEEWQADVAGAAELGMPTVSVVAGAVTTAFTVDRVIPSATGVSLGRAFVRWLGIATGFGVSATLLVGGYRMYGGFGSPAERGVAGGELLTGVAILVPAVGAVFALVALAAALWAIRLAVAAGRRVVVGALVLGIAVLGVLVLDDRVAPVLFVAGAIPGFLLVVILAVLLTGRRGGDPAAGGMPALGVGFALAAVAACAVGILHVYVWNPVAAVPGLGLDEIYAALDAAGENPGAVAMATAWGVLTLAGIVAYLVLIAPRRGRRPAASTRRVVAVGLSLIAATLLVGFVASFGMGMGVADTFLTSGGDSALSGPLLAIAGLGTVVGAVLTTFVRPAHADEEREPVAAPA